MIWVDVWPEELRSATSRSHGPLSVQHQAVLVTFLEFRKLTESCTERMRNSSNVQVCHVRGKFTRPSPVLVATASDKRWGEKACNRSIHAFSGAYNALHVHYLVTWLLM